MERLTFLIDCDSTTIFDLQKIVQDQKDLVGYYNLDQIENVIDLLDEIQEEKTPS